MSTEVFDFDKLPRCSALCSWRERARSTEPLLDSLESKLRGVRLHLLGIPAEDDIEVRIFDSAAEFSRAVEQAGRRVLPHLRRWAETCHASAVSVGDLLPRVANESEALAGLFRVELGGDELAESYHCYAPEGWANPDGKRTPILLVGHVPRGVDWRSLVAVEWCMTGTGRGKMPPAHYDFAFETLAALRACAAFVILDNGIALVCRRPVELHFDSLGRLGRCDGPAVVWANGEIEFYLADQAFPRVLRDRCNQLYHGTANPWPQPDMEWEEKLTRDLCDDYLYPVRKSGAELTKVIREGLAENPLFSSWFFEEDLRAGRYIVWDTAGPWSQDGRTVLREMQLRRVERGSEVRHYLCELGADHHADRIIEVPDRFFRVEDALAWTLDPQGFSKAAGEKTEP